MGAESPKSPFLEPRLPLYKKFGGREKIEGILKEFKDPESLQETANYFFGTGNTPESLSEKEVERFRVFADFGIKRLLNTEMHRKAGTYMKIHDRLARQFISVAHEFPLVLHDLSHLAGSVITGRDKINQNSPVPPFYEFKEFHEYNNREVMENELYGFMWGTYNPFTQNLFPLGYLPRAQSLEEFIELYVSECMLSTFHENRRTILEYARKNYKTPDTHLSFVWDSEEEAKQIVEDIEANPPAEIVRMLTYIWEHKENPRVLADLFFEELGPYIDNLQKRKAYADSHPEVKT